MDEIHEPWSCEEQTVYAETRGKAKSEMMKTDAKHYKLDITEEDITFLNVPIIRDEDSDIVKIQDREISRYSAMEYLEQIKKRDKIILHSSNEFYRQHTREYVGNAVGFWALNGKGYTIDPKKAHVYTKDDVLNSFGNYGWDHQTYFIPVEAARAAIRSYVESQAISQEDRI